MDFDKIAQSLLPLLGGKENIASAAHCATRLRLVLVDDTLADQHAIGQIDGVKGCFRNSGQMQIIFGTGVVNKVYAAFIQVAGISESSKADTARLAAQKLNPFQRIARLLSNIFVPIIPAIVASGLLMGLLGMVKTYGWVNADNAIYILLDMCSSAAFIKGKLREQFHFLRSPAPWLIFAATMFGNAGVFAWFSYVKPYMMFISGFSETAMTFIMMLVGLGMVLGNMLSGRISGRYSPLRIAAVTDFIIVLALLMLFFFGGMKTTSLIFAFICCAGLFALSAPLQILLLQNAKGGELLGAAGGQIAFNLGSAVGAYCGGMMLTLGLAYNYVALPAALLSFAAMSSLLLYGRYKRQQAADSPVLAKPLG
ncbi:glucose PTS transporter subunit EIIB [Escherichia coli]|nr:glucose PTS transporter subunit EIIB [Escherichia coli]